MSKLLDELSTPSTKSELDLFTVPPTQIAVRRSFWSEVQLQNPCTNDGPFEFRLTPDAYLLDLSKNYIRFVARILKHDGSDCSVTTQADGSLKGDLVIPINMIGKTFFKQIKIYLNSKLISDSGDHYAYRSMIETDLNYGQEAKHTQLQAAMYFNDSEKETGIKNTGYMKRLELFNNSKYVEIMAPIHADIMLQDRFLINQCELRIEMYRNSDNFCLIDMGKSKEKYKLDLKEMSLFIKKVEVNDSINLAIESMLQNTTVKYPIRRVQLTTLHITENRRSTPLNSLFSGPLPRRIVIGMVATEAARGTYETSPFRFNDFGITDLKITSGTIQVPSTPYRLDFEKNQFIRPYLQLFDGIGIAGEDKGNFIDFSRFKNGSCYFVFELGCDVESNTWQLVNEGTTSLEINFGNQIPKNGIDCVIYAEFDSLIMIDHARQTYTDFSV